MKAILRAGAALVGVLLAGSVSFGYVWVSPVTKCPLPIAPDCFGPGMYHRGPYGMWYGPSYYLMPPCGPFNGFLPGKTGEALMTGGLPLTKDYKIAPIDATMPKEMQGPQPPQPGHLPYAGTMQPLHPGQMPWAQSMQGPQPPLGYGMPSHYQRPYPMPMPMPYPAPMPYPVPMPQAPPRPMGYVPYQGPQGVSYVPVSRDPATGIWLVQGTNPNQGAFRPIPSFNAPMPQPMPPQQRPMPMGQPMPYGYGYGPMPMPMNPGYPMQAPPINPGYTMQTPTGPGYPMPMPTAPPMIPPMNPGYPMQTPPVPMMPTTPGMPSTMPYQVYGPNNGFQYFLGDPDPSNKMSPLQGPQTPRMDMEPLQLPRMDTFGPPPQRVGGPFPTHPFVRSPRDFFMWGNTMDDERARGSRPNPVP